MLVSNLSNIGVTAVQNGLNRVDQAAAQIAKASMGNDTAAQPTDLIKPVLAMQEASLDTKAAVKLLDAQDKTMGSLLDAFA